MVYLAVPQSLPLLLISWLATNFRYPFLTSYSQKSWFRPPAVPSFPYVTALLLVSMLAHVLSLEEQPHTETVPITWFTSQMPAMARASPEPGFCFWSLPPREAHQQEAGIPSRIEPKCSSTKWKCPKKQLNYYTKCLLWETIKKKAIVRNAYCAPNGSSLSFTLLAHGKCCFTCISCTFPMTVLFESKPQEPAL